MRRRFLALAALAFLALAAPAAAWGAAITSAATGAWNAAGTWTGGVIPASGDTVTIADGHAVTVPAGYTAVCGTSPADDTGAVALQCSSTAGTGILVVNGTLQWQGPVRQANATWTVGAGGTLTYDASAATTPATALYTWRISQAASQANAKLVLAGTSGSHCTVNSVGNVQSGGFGTMTNNFVDGGRIAATWTDWSHQGGAANTSYWIYSRVFTAATTLDDCTATGCGMIFANGQSGAATGIGPTATFRVNRTRITAPANLTYTMQLNTGFPRTTGVRQITNCDIAGNTQFFPNDGTGAPINTNFTVTNNVLRARDLATTGTVPGCVAGAGGGCDAWDQNLVALLTASATVAQDPGIVPLSGLATNTYLFRLPSPTAFGANMHPVYLNQKTSSPELSGWVFQTCAADTAGDMVNLTIDSTAAQTLKIHNCLYLPNSAGNAVGSLLNNQGSVSQTNTKTYFEHNTIGGGVAMPNTGLVWGVGFENSTAPVGAVPSIQSNLLWRSAAGTDTVANSGNTATVASGAVTVADYQWTYNVTGSIYGNPSAQFAATPGAHDGSGDPQFVDSSRSLLTFDQGYSGAAVATAWVTGHAYSVGDLASSSVAGYFGGQAQNWRCVVAHTSGSTTQPGSGANFVSNWEPAALKTISDSVLAGTTYSGGTNSLIGELVAWTKAGFVVRNSSLNNAGHDGATIGAMGYQAASTIAPRRVLAPTRGRVVGSAAPDCFRRDPANPLLVTLKRAG